ncbi:MAG: hypothetical protein JRH20_12100 [Deltaproteobacteria bacterium]|nr:hypothetical protein [Deltaproteobacteria bacterium]
MRSSNYPLQPLLRLREEIQQQRERELAEAIGKEESASKALMVAQDTEAAASHDISLRREAQAGQLGAAQVADLQRSSSYIRRLEQRLGELQSHSQRCLNEQQAHMEATRFARERVAEALRQAEVIRRDFERWTSAQREAAQRRAEQELEDLVVSRYVATRPH